MSAHIYESRRATLSSPAEYDEVIVCDACERSDVPFAEGRTDYCAACAPLWDNDEDIQPVATEVVDGETVDTYILRAFGPHDNPMEAL